MVKNKLLLLSLLGIFSIEGMSVTPKAQKNIESAIENSGFDKLLLTRNQLSSGNNKALLGRASKFSGANNVSAEKATQQANDLGSILSSLNQSGAAQKAIEQNCTTIFNDLAKYDQNQVLKIISNKISIPGLQTLCPTQVTQLLAATKK